MLVEVICFEVLQIMSDSLESEGRTVKPCTQGMEMWLGGAVRVLAGFKSA